MSSETSVRGIVFVPGGEPGSQRRLLREICESGSFRADLVREPAETLARLGLAIDRAALPESVVLPSAEELRRGLAALADDEEEIRLPWVQLLSRAPDSCSASSPAVQ